MNLKKFIPPAIKKIIISNRFVRGINRKNSSRRLLISYTILPFIRNKNSHTNYQESLAIVDVFSEMGYEVDVIHYNSLRKIKYSNYDIIFGFGEPFEKSFYDKSFSGVRLFYATGAHSYHQNITESKRVISFNRKFQADLIPKRIVSSSWTLSTMFSNELIVIGNEWTAQTYRKYTDTQVTPINATALINSNYNELSRDLSLARKEFLWFGSLGLVHKGLDICLEFFSKNPELILHICGPVENDFFEVFSDILQLENIVYHGFVDVSSDVFLQIVDRALFSILPSCSEGQATSLLTTMAVGLIPIATRYTGVDVDLHGYILEEADYESLDKVVKSLELESIDLLAYQSKQCCRYIKEKHTIDYFKESLRKIMRRVDNEY